MQSRDQNDREGVVKLGRLMTVIPAGQTREVKCSVRTGPLHTKQEVLFEAEEIPKWPEGLNITDTVICLQKGNWSRVAIPVTNGSKQDITLSPRTVLGKLQQVKTIYPVDLRAKAKEFQPQATVRELEQTAEAVEGPVRDDEVNTGQVSSSDGADKVNAGQGSSSDGADEVNAGQGSSSDGADEVNAGQVSSSDGADKVNAGQVSSSDGDDEVNAGQQLTGSLLAVAFISSFGSSMLYGYNLAVVNSPAVYIKDFYNQTVVSRNGTGLSAETLTLMYSLTVSVFAIGGLLGSVIVGMLVSRFGSVVPMYLGEIAPKNLRGFLGLVPSIFIGTGVFLAQILGLHELLGKVFEHARPRTLLSLKKHILDTRCAEIDNIH
ncbi:Solute carrier family 2, facilitated glucose transporter member 9 [Liparis tanakae]|uniref:Solute carrier family 2, facilitated glucose transporter member 9 n=1 Tax=Liparis tanakae TaxID=230148 RepID=A0A4Z2G6R5_9TELE|nr:Solute carrier family 2, facilitated glucose transporter member 9 [Liparis tanakae]